MIKKIVILFTFISSFVFGQVNDYRNILSEEEKQNLLLKIQNFEQDKGIKLFVNTLDENEGFQTEEQEKIIIINLFDLKNDIIKIQIQMSQDLNQSEQASEIALLLESLEEYIKENKKDEMVNQLIDGLADIIQKEEESKEIVEEDNDGLGTKSKIFIGVLLTILALYIRILYVKRKRKKIRIKRNR